MTANKDFNQFIIFVLNQAASMLSCYSLDKPANDMLCKKNLVGGCSGGTFCKSSKVYQNEINNIFLIRFL